MDQLRPSDFLVSLLQSTFWAVLSRPYERQVLINIMEKREYVGDQHFLHTYTEQKRKRYFLAFGQNGRKAFFYFIFFFFVK